MNSSNIKETVIAKNISRDISVFCRFGLLFFGSAVSYHSRRCRPIGRTLRAVCVWTWAFPVAPLHSPSPPSIYGHRLTRRKPGASPQCHWSPRVTLPAPRGRLIVPKLAQLARTRTREHDTLQQWPRCVKTPWHESLGCQHCSAVRT